MDQPKDPAGAVNPAKGAGRLKLIIAYDGRPFRGWQSQTHGDTVQDRLETAFGRLCGDRKIAVHGSGRTDAGVHARGQVAHADVPDRERRDPLRWCLALNAHLPPEVRVMKVRFVTPDFHARYSAHRKTYRYVIWNAPVMHPLWLGRAWHVPGKIDSATLADTCHLFLGTHDFAAFAANRGEPVTDTMRTIYSIEVSTCRRRTTLIFSGNGFLYKMVRLLTGSIIRCALGRAPLDWLRDLLTGHGKSHFAAPADGLYLERVFYTEPPRDS